MIMDLVISDAKTERRHDGCSETGNSGLRYCHPAEVSVTARLKDKVYI